MSDFGGFPSCVLVRKEMKDVWEIVSDGISNKSKYVLVGSSGVGKSVLIVLLCFHLAKQLNIPVFLVRQLKGEEGRQQGDTIAICIQPNGHFYTSIDITAISRGFGDRFKGIRLITVLDGWSQEELKSSFMGNKYGNFHLLATSLSIDVKGKILRN
jgi:predicted ATP-dependent serine protease